MFKQFFFIAVVIYSMPSCTKKNTREIIIKAETSYDTLYLLQCIDTLFDIKYRGDTVEFKRIMKLFNNEDLARKRPDIVFKAYHVGYSGVGDFEIKDSSKSLRDFQDFYSRFSDLALKSKSDKMLIYKQYALEDIIMNLATMKKPYPFYY